MASLVTYGETLRKKLCNPLHRLKMQPLLSPSVYIEKKSISSVTKLSRFLYIVSCPFPLYISTVFSPDFSFTKTPFSKVILTRQYDDIYYDLVVET